MGIEPTSRPWEGHILPMNYTRTKKGFQWKPLQLTFLNYSGIKTSGQDENRHVISLLKGREGV